MRDRGFWIVLHALQAHLVPVLLDVYGPLPLEVLRLVVVGEDRVDRVGAPLNHAGRGVLDRGQGGVELGLGGVGADHVGHLVHRNASPEED